MYICIPLTSIKEHVVSFHLFLETNFVYRYLYDICRSKHESHMHRFTWKSYWFLLYDLFRQLFLMKWIWRTPGVAESSTKNVNNSFTVSSHTHTHTLKLKMCHNRLLCKANSNCYLYCVMWVVLAWAKLPMISSFEWLSVTFYSQH